MTVVEYVVHAQLLSCLTLFDSMDYSPPGSSVHGIFPGKNTEVGCHFLLQRIFPSQGSNSCLLCLLHCRQILYHYATWEALIPQTVVLITADQNLSVKYLLIKKTPVSELAEWLSVTLKEIAQTVVEQFIKNCCIMWSDS